VAKVNLNAAPVVRSGSPRALWWTGLAWSLIVVTAAAALLQVRLNQHLDQAAITAGLRLTGANDTLAISLQQLAAIPLNLAHRPLMIEALARLRGAAAAAPPTGLVYDSSSTEVGQTLGRIGVDFALPLVALINNEGRIVAANRFTGGVSNDVSSRTYFSDALAHGSAAQFLLDRATREPGVYFSQRVMSQGVAVGVAVVKQDSKTLNRLLIEADSARVLITDANGVVVLGNSPDMLLQRVPGGPAHPDDFWNAIYQRIPPLLAWSQSDAGREGKPLTITRAGGLRHVTLSSALRDTPFKVWVLEPLTEEGPTRAAPSPLRC